MSTADHPAHPRVPGAGPSRAEPSLHRRILDDIEGRILSGAWPPGHRLPFELDLAADYACSRMTVNKVMTELAKSGLIERRRKSGSFVAQPRAQAAVLDIRDIKHEVEALGLAYGYRLAARSRRRSGAEDRRRLDLAAPVPVLDLAARHLAGNRPFCFEERLINLEAVPEAAQEPFEQVAPGPWLLGRVPWSTAEHTIRAVAADARIADALGIPPGSPCLTVERRTWTAGRCITFVRLSYPGGSHALVAHFQPSQPK